MNLARFGEGVEDDGGRRATAAAAAAEIVAASPAALLLSRRRSNGHRRGRGGDTMGQDDLPRLARINLSRVGARARV